VGAAQIITATAALIVLLSNAAVHSETVDVKYRGILNGQATVIDGDTLEIRGTRIRLLGNDVPESDQLYRNQSSEHYRCGQRAANELDAVECVEVDRDQYKRVVAVSTAARIDLAEWLVKNGLALDWPRYSRSANRPVQSEAKRGNVGIWGGLSENLGGIGRAEE
jgi:endonuclease YncB( thermonuclease family)